MNGIHVKSYRPLLWRSARIAFVVGTVLNLINQGEAIFSGNQVAWTHIALNYCVPFIVSTYSAIKSARHIRGQ